MPNTLNAEQNQIVEQLCAAASPQEHQAFVWLQNHPKQLSLLASKGPDFDPELLTLFHDLKEENFNELALFTFYQSIPAFPFSETEKAKLMQAPHQDMMGLLDCWSNLLLELMHQLPDGYGLFQSIAGGPHYFSKLCLIPHYTVEELIALHHTLVDSRLYQLAALVLACLHQQTSIS